ncbi:MAG: hypothetical protein E3K37_13540 [Candidatus Kuenenia sp.]|nr:hypothetical protein [Candidatus Kuenenia hertensis]
MENNNEWIAIREDGKEGIRELSNVLSGADIESRVTIAPGCSTGKCGCKYLLLVTRKDAQAAHACIEEFHVGKYPEIKTSQEWEAEGKCPACGYCVGEDAKECPDCGLLLIIEG